jgi:hypothetical protein
VDEEREFATQARTEVLMQELASMIESLPVGASVPSYDLVTAMVELEDLQHQLEFIRGDSSEADEPDALQRVPLIPRPHLSSGAISLPEPEEES